MQYDVLIPMKNLCVLFFDDKAYNNCSGTEMRKMLTKVNKCRANKLGQTSKKYRYKSS